MMPSRGVLALQIAVTLATWMLAAVLAGASVAVVLLVGVGAVAVLGVLALTGAQVATWAERRSEQADERVRVEMGPLLAEWMGVADSAALDRSDLDAWRQVRGGLTVEQASRWGRAGLPYTLAAVAVRAGITVDAVLSLAALMRRCGAWDGSDRRALHDLIGEHLDITDGSLYPVLQRWARFSHGEIEAAVRKELSVADVAWSPFQPESRAQRAGEHALYVLEGFQPSLADR